LTNDHQVHVVGWFDIDLVGERTEDERIVDPGAVRRWPLFSCIALLALSVAIFLPGECRFWALAVAALLDVGAALQAANAAELRLFSGHFS
jgi:hypothetical protein